VANPVRRQRGNQVEKAAGAACASSRRSRRRPTAGIYTLCRQAGGRTAAPERLPGMAERQQLEVPRR